MNLVDNFNKYNEYNDSNNQFSKSQMNFYPTKYKDTESNQPPAQNLMNNYSSQINENFEDRLYIEDISNSFHYIGKPILNSNLYEFSCYQNYKYIKKNLAMIKDFNEVMKEINFLNQLNHKNILYCETFFTEDKKTYMLYEYCGNMTLEQYLKQKKKLPENEVKLIISELINLLFYLRSQNIIHRNLRLSNIIMTKEGGIKVMGFESAKKLSPGQNSIKESFSPFDQINCIFCPDTLKDSYISFSYESDLWAVGRIMYYLLLGYYSMIGGYTDMINSLKPIPCGISHQAVDCLRRLLKPNPQKRHKLNLIYMLPFFNQ